MKRAPTDKAALSAWPNPTARCSTCSSTCSSTIAEAPQPWASSSASRRLRPRCVEGVGVGSSGAGRLTYGTVGRNNLAGQMARTQKNKATSAHLGLLKARIAKLRRELLTPSKSGGGAGEGACWTHDRRTAPPPANPDRSLSIAAAPTQGSMWPKRVSLESDSLVRPGNGQGVGQGGACPDVGALLLSPSSPAANPDRRACARPAALCAIRVSIGRQVDAHDQAHGDVLGGRRLRVHHAHHRARYGVRRTSVLSRGLGRGLTLDACGWHGVWIPGVLQVRGAKFQILDLPGIIEGAKDGKGRGRQVIAGTH